MVSFPQASPPNPCALLFDLREVIVCTFIEDYINFFICVDRKLSAVAVKIILKIRNKLIINILIPNQLNVSSEFSREADENCAILGYYAASGGNFSPTFRDNL